MNFFLYFFNIICICISIKELITFVHSRNLERSARPFVRASVSAVSAQARRPLTEASCQTHPLV